MKTQFFSHRAPSNTTLLSDPWPNALQVRKHRKTFHWPAYRQGQKGHGPKGMAGSSSENRLSLQA